MTTLTEQQLEDTLINQLVQNDCERVIIPNVDTGQIKTHAYMQVCKLMEYYNSGNQNKILVLANPDIPRIRTRVEKVRKSIEVLEFIQFWVQEDLTVKVEYPKASRQILMKLNLIDHQNNLTFN